ncbi:MAG: hypothetical protein KAT00_11540 [Planctomycetes bacterium]|nr:hypothetical protein [Planctomycetota bacterium]
MIRSTNGERHNIWKEGRDLIRTEKPIPKHPAFENVELNIVPLSAVK